MAIYTNTLNGKKKCEHTTWFDLIADGWVFQYLDENNHAQMTKNGYLNEFWNDVE